MPGSETSGCAVALPTVHTVAVVRVADLDATNLAAAAKTRAARTDVTMKASGGGAFKSRIGSRASGRSVVHRTGM
ncbi:hypothetical protein BCR44DRAFT_1444025 [Catenaria anguillulae PL171]|uniref:Uncharacterized protein n=1 Tax=Catenaria anguillulae PL171 TaxID=765915 RepID=A0A1Y2H7X8_9FUNG|nr:hypothetical protein BCR44DRAFT_1444025 [Catenaria anguillulae PL171]